MFQASTRKWKGVAASLLLWPLVQGGVQAQTAAPTPAAAQTTVGAVTASGGTITDQARELLSQGRHALAAGDMNTAKRRALQAQSLRAPLGFAEDSPTKLLADINRRTARGAAPSSDPKTLVKQGREALAAGDYEQAQTLGNQANASGAKWGFFEDTPAKLLDDVAKARAKADKAKSVQVLAEARGAYERGDYDKAEQLSFQAENLHGPYSLWDTGERPDKLRTEITAARAKGKKTNGATPAVAAKPMTDGKPAVPPVQQVGFNAKTPTPPAPAPNWNPPAAPSAPMAGGGDAQALISEAKGLIRSGQLVAARGKLVTAQKLRANYGPNDERPEPLIGQVMAEGQAQIQALLKEASTQATGAKGTKPNAANAEACLTAAKEMAVGLGLDSDAIDRQRAQLPKSAPTAPTMPGVTGTASVSMPAAPAGMNAGVVSTPLTPATNTQGIEMLAKARIEIRKGELETARKLATEVFSGPFKLQDEASALLRTIDAEEFAQKRTSARRAFDAGMSAYVAKDYPQCLAVLQVIDASYLPADQQAKLKETVGACQVALKPPAPPTPVMPAVVQAPTPSAPVMPAAAPAPVAPTLPTPVAPPMPLVQAPPAMPMMPAPVAPPAPLMPAPVAPPALVAQAPTLPAPTPLPTEPAKVTPKAETPKPTGGDPATQKALALQEIEFQKLREEGLRVQREARGKFERGETDTAIAQLQEYVGKLKDTNLDPAKVALLQRSADLRLAEFKMMKKQRDFEHGQANVRKDFATKQTAKLNAEEHKKAEVGKLMKQFNVAYEEGKYADAETLAMKAHELDPDDPATAAAIHIARVHKNLNDYTKIKKDRESMFLTQMNDSETQGPVVTTTNPVALDPDSRLRSQHRANLSRGLDLHNVTDRERDIQRKLTTPVSLELKNTPLSQAIDDLKGITGLNIIIDAPALEEEGISANKPINLKIDNISLKSALNLLTDQVRLTHIIKDDVLQITTNRHAKGKLIQKTYSVVDLVLPVDNYAIPETSNLQRVLSRGALDNNNVMLNGITPTQNAFSLTNGQPVGNSSTATLRNTGTIGAPPGAMNPASPMSASANTTLAKNTMEDMLIRLITNTVAPQSWSDVGGPGTIEYFPIGMALVINQTATVQEDVADLLDALRRLQDLEVSVEVRIITLAETFFERIGLDFALNLKTNTKKFEPGLTTGIFKPDGFVNDAHPSNIVTGLTPAGTFTKDLDIPIKSTSFEYAIPAYGGYPNIPGANGGLSLGLAFLSDIQVFMFMEAAQGDRRTNVMQAPKLTLFNGQTASITVQEQQFFVTNVAVVSANGQIVFVPQNQPFPLGVSMTIQAVVSADRRFVRLNLAPQLSNLSSATVPLFPITTFVTPVFEGGIQGTPIPFTQFIQQPAFSTVNIQTTVSVPDGGTVLLGGLKTMSEGRNEFGPPVLSKVPYVNRLFKNVGYGREAQSLLIMVTPRVIINTEEEERQTGVANARTE